MKVLHIFKISGISGSENHLLTLLPEMGKKIKIVVVMMVEPNNPVFQFSRKLEILGIRVFRLKIRFDISVLTFLNILKIIKAEKPDIVHTHLIHGDFYGILAAKMAGIKRIISSKHNDNEFRKRFFVRKVNSYLNTKTKKIIVISKALKDFFMKYENIDSEKIEVVYYGLGNFEQTLKIRDLREELGYNQDNIVFGIVARLTKQKGHKYLIRAFEEVVVAYPNTRLLIVGDGELRGELEKLSSGLHLTDYVRFIGRKENTGDVYNVLDVFIHPSLWEGFGLVFLEAMSFSLPIIATQTSAIPEVVDNYKSGILVKPKNIIELKNAMIWMIENPEERIAMGIEGKKKVESDFGLESMVDRIYSIYNQI